jgi:preprotein translocase subunit SecG
MSILITLLLIVLVISSLLLIGVILLQRSKSEGLGLAFGASTGESLFGARAGNVLTKITVILGIVFMASALLLGVLYAKKDQPLMNQVTTNLVESESASEEAGE